MSYLVPHQKLKTNSFCNMPTHMHAIRWQLKFLALDKHHTCVYQLSQLFCESHVFFHIHDLISASFYHTYILSMLFFNLLFRGALLEQWGTQTHNCSLLVNLTLHLYFHFNITAGPSIYINEDVSSFIRYYNH